MQAQVVSAPLHQRRRERHAKRFLQRGKVLEENLLLKVLGAGGDEHTLAAQDGGNQVGERLSGAGTGLGQQRPAVLDDGRDRLGHPALALARLVPVDNMGERPAS
jgi:hypothetical protein